MHHINKILGNDVIEKSIFKFVSGLRCPKDVTNRGMISERHEIKSIHNKLIHALYNMLNKQYPNQVGCEIQVTGQHRVDIVVRENDDTYMFYEIKSYNDVHKCIKEGIGQLMNYKFLVRNCCSISQLVIVGYADTTDEVEEYINMYRSEELPISYLQIQI